MNSFDKDEEELVIISSNISVDPARRVIYLRKNSMTPEDKVSLGFAKVLNEQGIKYAIVAGYVAILFGRARRSDGIDFISDHLSLQEFLELN